MASRDVFATPVTGEGSSKQCTRVVSVVIPCCNQGHFLAEAIDSVLGQTYPDTEIIVVNDGSTDSTADVASRYPQVRYVFQENQGLAAARNTGVQHSTGAYLVFLDADDRLLPTALAHGVEYLQAHLQCVMVSGHYRNIAADGNVLPTWREQRLGSAQCYISGDYQLIGGDGTILRTWPQQRLASEHYTVLLQRNYIVMHATVMYRRAVFETVGGFDTAFCACEDYEFYLRVARQLPIACHDHVVAEYRQHGSNMTRNSARMLITALAALHAQRPYVAGRRPYETAYTLGEKNWRAFYAKRLLREAWGQLKRGSTSQALESAPILWYYLRSRLDWLVQYPLEMGKRRLGMGFRRLHRLPIGRVDFGALRRVVPLRKGTDFPPEQAIDAYYLRRFLDQHGGDMRGHVLEVGDGRMTLPWRGAHDAAEPFRMTLVEDVKVAADLPAGTFDCLVVPHCLQLDYDLQTAIQTMYGLLRPGGVMLVTLPGISIHQSVAQTYWAFTTQATARLWAETLPSAQSTVVAYGNVLATIAFLYGISAQELSQEELDAYDPHYQILVAVRAVKPQG